MAAQKVLMASVDDVEHYAEEECTFEFGEEELPEPAPPMSSIVGGPRFIEYPGEDFSKYLSETPNDAADYSQVSYGAG